MRYYLSYANADTPFALDFAARLKNAGVSLWVDRIDAHSPSAAPSTLGSIVQPPMAVLALISPAYLHSPYARYEQHYFKQKGIPIIPVLLGNAALPQDHAATMHAPYLGFQQAHTAQEHQQHMDAFITLLAQEFNLTLTPPPPDVQYLHRLIAALEPRKGALLHIDSALEAWRSVANSGRDPVREQRGYITQWNAPERFQLLLPKAKKGISFHTLDEILHGLRCVYLLGSDGEGKRSAIDQLVLQAAHARLAGDAAVPLPLYFHATDFSNATEIEQSIQRNFTWLPNVLPMLTQGEAALWIDATCDPQGIALTALAGWLKTKQETLLRAVVAAAAPEGEKLPLRAFPVVTINALHQAHIDQFITTYLGAERLEAFQSARVLSWQAHSVPLADNLFWISLLALFHARQQDQLFSASKPQLLRAYVRLIWGDAGLADDGLPHLVAALSGLALHMLETAHYYCEDANTVTAQIGAERLYQAEMLGLLLRTGGQISFANEALQRYFAAEGMTTERLAKLLSKTLFSADGGTARAQRRDWEIVVSWWVCFAENADTVVQVIARANPRLALYCILQHGAVGSPTIEIACAALVKTLTSTDPDSAEIAAVAADFSNRVYPPVLSALLHLARRGTWKDRQHAVALLQALPTVPFPGLMQSLQQLDFRIQAVVATGMRLLGEQAVPTLLTALRGASWMVRRSAAWALSEIGDAAAAPALVGLLADSDPLVVREAATALAAFHEIDALPQLFTLFGHTDWRVRQAAARTISGFGSVALDGLLKALIDDNPEVRQLAIIGLQAIDDSRAARALIDISFDDHVDVRGTAVEALGEMEDIEAVKRLIECLSDYAPIRKEHQLIADVALSVLQGKNLLDEGYTLEKWRRENSAGKKRIENQILHVFSKQLVAPVATAATAKERLMRITTQVPAVPPDVPEDPTQSESTADLLAAVLEDLHAEDVEVRMKAVNQLAAYKNPQALHAFTQLLLDDNLLISEVALSVLEQAGEEATPALIPLLRGSNTQIVVAAIDLLGKIRSAAAVPALTECLANTSQFETAKPYARVCDAAAKALLAINTPEAQQAVLAWRKQLFQQHAAEKHVDYAFPSSVMQPEYLHAGETDTHVKADTPARFRALLREIRHEDWEQQQQASKQLVTLAHGLREGEHPALVTLLVDELNDSLWTVRWTAVQALAWFCDPAAAIPIHARLRDENWMVRIAAIRALIELKDITAADAIAELLHDPQNAVREAAAEALGILNLPGSFEALLSAVNDPDEFVRLVVTEALGRFREAALPTLISRLDDIAMHVRWTAARALSEIANVRVVNQLIPYLHDRSAPTWEEKRVCDWIADALKRINTPQARYALEKWQGGKASSNLEGE